MKTRIKNDKLKEALELLNEAAKEKREELYELIGDKYSHVREILNDRTENGKEAADRLKKHITKSLKEEEEKLIDKAKEFDENIHENPWFYLGIVAVSSMVLGIMMSHRK